MSDTQSLIERVEGLRNRAHWWLVWLAYHAWMRLPMDWRFSWWLLPHAGHYAYSPRFADFCDTLKPRDLQSQEEGR